MSKRKCRRLCKLALEQAGFKNPMIIMERMGKIYNSYWCSDWRRAEVACEKETGTVYVMEVSLTDQFSIIQKA